MSSVENVIDVIESYLGSRITFKTVSDLRKLSHPELSRLIEMIKLSYVSQYYFVDRDELPEPQPTARIAFFTDPKGEEDSFNQWHQDARFIKQLLLYYPSVAVLDPIDEILSTDSPIALESALRQILPLRKLLQDGPSAPRPLSAA